MNWGMLKRACNDAEYFPGFECLESKEMIGNVVVRVFILLLSSAAAVAIVVDRWCDYRNNEWTPFIIHRWSHQRWTNEWGPFISRRNENMIKNLYHTKNVSVLPQNTMDLFCRGRHRTIQNRMDNCQ